jgi:hypothetical protein
VDFTREPIIETIITPKEGSKLVVRSSKGVVQDEYFCDAVQVVSYGNAFFFRSIERPKAFLVPVTDYEILEVREARMVLKNVGVERTIKIGGGREAGARSSREQPAEKQTADADESRKAVAAVSDVRPGADGRPDKKRERRRQGRRRRGHDDQPSESPPREVTEESFEGTPAIDKEQPSTGLTSILPPPSQLISETLQQYRSNDLFKDIFSRTTEAEGEESAISPIPFVPQSTDEPT